MLKGSAQGDDDDARLTSSVAKGDWQAFAVLFDRNPGSVVRFCYRFASTTARAEELAQDIFVKLFAQRQGLPAHRKIQDVLLSHRHQRLAFTCICV